MAGVAENERLTRRALRDVATTFVGTVEDTATLLSVAVLLCRIRCPRPDIPQGGDS